VQTLTLVRPKRKARQLMLVPAAESTRKVGANKVQSDAAAQGHARGS
jgi:hypothetical protein